MQLFKLFGIGAITYSTVSLCFTPIILLLYLGSQEKVSARHASWIAYLQQFTFVIKHESGKLNKVADALSRRHNLISTLHVSVPGFDSFAELYSSDPFFFQDLGVNSNQCSR